VSGLTWYHSSKRYKSEDHSFSSRGETVVRGKLVLRWKAILHPMRILARSKQRGVFVSHYGTEKEESAKIDVEQYGPESTRMLKEAAVAKRIRIAHRLHEYTHIGASASPIS
jgi:hypothetical protein